MSHATIDGHELSYERTGSGAPLLLIMGLSGTHLSWGEPFLEALRGDFEVLSYDHRGVGRSSPADGPFAIADLAADASGLLAAVGWESAHVAGISMGGMIAQELALAHPEQVRTLTLGCTFAGGATAVATPPESVAQLGEAFASGDRETLLRTNWTVNVSAGFAADPAAWERFRATALALPVAAAVTMLQLQALSQHDTIDRLSAITAPTLIVHGTEDALLPVGNAALMADQITGARVEILDGVGHCFFWERPAASAALIRDHALAGTPA